MSFGILIGPVLFIIIFAGVELADVLVSGYEPTSIIFLPPIT